MFNTYALISCGNSNSEYVHVETMQRSIVGHQCRTYPGGCTGSKIVDILEKKSIYSVNKIITIPGQDRPVVTPVGAIRSKPLHSSTHAIHQRAHISPDRPQWSRRDRCLDFPQIFWQTGYSLCENCIPQTDKVNKLICYLSTCRLNNILERIRVWCHSGRGQHAHTCQSTLASRSFQRLRQRK